MRSLESHRERSCVTVCGNCRSVFPRTSPCRRPGAPDKSGLPQTRLAANLAGGPENISQPHSVHLPRKKRNWIGSGVQRNGE